MPKIFIFILLLALNSFAAYFDVGLGLGKMSSKLENFNVEKLCPDCDHTSFSIGGRMGSFTSQRTAFALDFEWNEDSYEAKGESVEFDYYTLGLALISYPIPHFQWSGSAGLSRGNIDVNARNGWVSARGLGFYLGASAAYDTGLKDGALIGIKAFYSHAEVGKDEQTSNINSTGIMLFVRFVHK